jgi:hypothetical protein
MLTKRFLVLLLISVVLLSLAPLLFGMSAKKLASETSPITLLSFVQLVASAVICWKVFRVRCTDVRPRLDSPEVVWAIMAAGFLYLSLDEVVRIHERLDFAIHTLFGIRETDLTDRLDDLIVGAYGLLGIVLLWVYRAELLRYRRLLPLIGIGFVFVLATVTLDTVTNMSEVPPAGAAEASPNLTMMYGLGVAEEVFKVLAEGVFLGAFYECLQTVVRAEGVESPRGRARLRRRSRALSA